MHPYSSPRPECRKQENYAKEKFIVCCGTDALGSM